MNSINMFPLRFNGFVVATVTKSSIPFYNIPS